MVQFNAQRFVSSNNAQAAVEDGARFAGLYVTNQTVNSGIRSIVHELLKQDASQTEITLGAEEAKALYDIVKAATAQSAQNTPRPSDSAQTPEGLPGHAQALGEIAARAGRDAPFVGGGIRSFRRLGDSINARPTDYATARDLGGQKTPGVPDVQSVNVTLSAGFNSTIRDLMKADAASAFAQNGDLAARAADAANFAQDRFLTSTTRQARHGGVFKNTVMKQVSELDAAGLARLALQRDVAALGVAFGFGEVGKTSPTLGQCHC